MVVVVGDGEGGWWLVVVGCVGDGVGGCWCRRWWWLIVISSSMDVTLTALSAHTWRSFG